MEGRTGALLQNHGAVAVGASLGEAYERAVLLEWLCSLYWHARQIGEPRALDTAALDAVREQATRLAYPGLAGSGDPPGMHRPGAAGW
jgi:L-fuculose-phosphate aldolase